jgi:opacity protein-like surface antigen
MYRERNCKGRVLGWPDRGECRQAAGIAEPLMREREFYRREEPRRRKVKAADALEIGAGVETALDEHWGVRFEYQYGFIQTINNVVDLQLINPNRVTVPTTVALHPQVQSAQVGLVYRFNN